ncbi:hypothetical protein [Arthrobacter sp. NicSoilB8]|uniref:hypothetical protein n=1 Tax=Arthrobacter sp. NicSoilB8 TaxID=2830998 RepID=UPI001CC743D2|nr:hypothetical protein [Arthrobacter sp. NicSoilB8]BCW73500.1 hypothetical protein NicSoilB8_45440 [Arthrobacter sp. NicSoilB8]
MAVHSSKSLFSDGHIGARRQTDVDDMLKAYGYDTVDAAVDIAVPKDIRTREYPCEQGVFPVHTLKQDKYFPPVGRIDGAAGDGNLICFCPPLEAFEVRSDDSAN